MSMVVLAIALATPSALAQEDAGQQAVELADPAMAMEQGDAGPHTHEGEEEHTHEGDPEPHTHDADEHTHEGDPEPHTHEGEEEHTHEGEDDSMRDAAGTAAMAREDEGRIVINEIEINPFGEDGFNTFEWVEIYNPTSSKVDVGGWTVTSGVTQTTTTIPSGVVLRPEQFFTFTRTGEWFVNVAESAILRNLQWEIVDETPQLIDVEDNLDTWQRKHDALDTDSRNDWHFDIYTRGTSNGKSTEREVPETISIHVATNKDMYEPGETVTISGSVGGIRPESTAFFLPAHVKITVNGTDYTSVTSITPGEDLRYETSIKLREALGTGLGVYDVVAKYVGSTAATSFTVASDEPEPEPEEAIEGLAMRTDTESYLPGDKVGVLAVSSQTFALEGLEYDVIDPRGTVIDKGVLFPSGVQRDSAQGGFGADGVQFAGTIYMSTIKPVYGSYSIVGNYGTLAASTAFALDRDVKEDTDISLASDSPVYGIGDIVSIDGRVNRVWADTVMLNIEQIQNTAVTPASKFVVFKQLKPMPDGRFDHEVSIPDDPDRIGRYTVSATDGPHSASTSFRVVEDPELHTDSEFSIRTDADSYDIGSKFIISGALGELDPLYQTAIVIVRFLAEGADPSDALLLSASPDAAGNYYVTNTVERGVFEPGEYKVTAMYIRGTVESVLGSVRENTVGERIESSVEYDFVGTYHTKSISNKPEHSATKMIIINDPRDLEGAHFTAELERKAFTFGDSVRLTGLTSAVVDIRALDVTVLRPNGKSTSSSVTVGEDGTYEWGWQTPTERHESNMGPYLLTVASTNEARELVFRVGGVEGDDGDRPPVTINVEGDSHERGSVVMITGTADVPEARGSYTYPANDQVRVVIADANNPRNMRNETFVTPDRSGEFEISERMTPGIYADGAYVVTATYRGDKARDTFYVGEVPMDVKATSVSLAEPSDAATGAEPPRRIVEERDADGTTASISVVARDVSGTILLPRSIVATLHAPAGTGASLSLTHVDGTCVIGSSTGCLVDGPTRSAGSLYRTVSIGAHDFSVRYSGDGSGPVKLTIIPMERGGSLPDSEWTVEAGNAGDAELTHKVVYTTQTP